MNLILDPFKYVSDLTCSLTTEKLMEIAKNEHIEVNRFPCSRNAIAICIDGNLYIAINEHLTQQQTREAFAHELGHCLTGGFYSMRKLHKLRLRPVNCLQMHGRSMPCYLLNG